MRVNPCMPPFFACGLQRRHWLLSVHSCHSSAWRSFVDAASLLLLETRDGGAHRGSGARGQGPAATSHDFVAGLGVALPDATCFTLHVLLAAESAHVPGPLLDLIALHDLSE